MEARLEAEAIDVTIPGTPVQLGHRHPMNKALDGKGGGNQELCCGRLPVCEEAALRDCLLSFAK